MPQDPWQYRPAGDFDLPPSQRTRSTRREAGFFSGLMQMSVLGMASTWLRVAHRLQVDGVERLPKTGAFVIIANHSSHLDLFVLLASLPWRRRGCATAVSAGDTFFSGPVRAWASAHMLNVLPLWRRGATGGALSDFRARLCGREEILVIFPEGTRSRTGAMAGFKPGLGRLVAGTSVPVVPCFIEGAHAALPPGKRLPALRPLRVKIGVAIDFAHCEDGKTAWLEIAATCENAVRQLMK